MMKNAVMVLLCLVCVVCSMAAQTEPKKDKLEFIYVLNLVPKYLDTKMWSEADNKAVGEHFERLKKLHSEGTLLLAGKTENWDEKMFGIVIYTADSFEKAKEIAESDPAVKAGVMTVEVFPYKISLMK